MIWNTVRIKQRYHYIAQGERRLFRFRVVTWWLFFIPIYRSEKILEHNV